MISVCFHKDLDHGIVNISNGLMELFWRQPNRLVGTIENTVLIFGAELKRKTAFLPKDCCFSYGMTSPFCSIYIIIKRKLFTFSCK